MPHELKNDAILAIFAIFAILALSGCSDEVVPGIAIKNVTVIDAVNGVRTERTVVFDGDNITYVGPASSAPDTAESIEAAGKYLIPGLWDMHVHLTFDDRFTDIMPASFLRYGVTAVRDTGGLLSNLLPVIEEMRSPSVIAPRVYFSGPLLDGEFVVYDGESAPEIGTQNLTAQQAAENVAMLKQAGASFIKIYEMVSPEVFDALRMAAAEHDMPIAAHVPLALTASEVGPSVGTMEHLRNIELDCASDHETLHKTRREMLMNPVGLSGYALRSSMHQLQRVGAIKALDKERCDYVLSRLSNTIQVPTAGLNTILLNSMFERDDWSEALSLMPDDVRKEWQRAPDWLPADKAQRDTTFARYTISMIKSMNAAGVPIGAGTDTPIAHAIPGYSLHNELEILVTAGLTPLEAIEAATVRPAEFLSLQDQMGSIDVGKVADLVLLDADPLEDINNIRKISAVVSQGRLLPN
ncbi:MAG: amidohydrolase family protein [Gammaproteobacteria bacterium]|nr:amidohydrolase family protein [Gammaproteobacteria bacterium]